MQHKAWEEIGIEAKPNSKPFIECSTTDENTYIVELSVSESRHFTEKIVVEVQDTCVHQHQHKECTEKVGQVAVNEIVDTVYVYQQRQGLPISHVREAVATYCSELGKRKSRTITEMYQMDTKNYKKQIIMSNCSTFENQVTTEPTT